MFINETFSALFFRLFNFAILLTLAVIGIKKYVLPYLRTSIAEQDFRNQELNHRQVFLTQELQRLEQETHTIVAAHERMRAQLEQWINTLRSNKIRMDNEYTKIAASVRDKKTVQVEWYVNNRARKAAAQAVYKDLNESLVHYFESENHAENYRDLILEKIGKNRCEL